MDLKWTPKWIQNGPKMEPKMDQKLTPNGPYIGDPYIGNPYIGNPYIWSPGLPKSSRFAKKVILGGKSALFAQKNHFLRKSRFWREKTQILLPKWKK